METMQRFTIRHSIEDVIDILGSTPVKPDLIPQINAVQIVNRAPIAHLAIERGIKALVKEAGGTYEKNHNLRPNFQKLMACNSCAAKFLEAAFDDAVRFYGFKRNSKGFTHLKSIEAYFSVTGNKKAFDRMRYWEIEQPPEEVIGKVSLLIHGELLRALRQLFGCGMDRRTVSQRVEGIVFEALVNDRWAELGHPPGSPKEAEVESYLEWLKGFSFRSEALADAKRRNFDIGNATANSVLVSAYQSLSQVNDPGVRYYLSTLDTLPRQQRDYIPEVEWLGPAAFQRGLVKSPAGSPLGYIERRTDGLWNIIPEVDGLVRVHTTAETQTDARAWLADLLSHPVTVAVAGTRRSLRLVGEAERLLMKPWVGLGDDTTPPESRTWELEFWDEGHGLELGNEITIEFQENPEEPVIQALKGTVSAVDRWKVSVNGDCYLDVIAETEQVVPE